MKKSVILFSGGPDSLAALEYARRESEVVGLVYFLRSLPAASLQAARSLSDYYSIPLTLIPYTSALPGNYFEALMTSHPYIVDRNLLFLTLTSIYIKTGAFGPDISSIYTGFVQGDPGIYDITSDFVSHLNSLLSLDTTYPLQVLAPYTDVSKETLFEDLLYKYFAPVHLTWSCFREGEYVGMLGGRGKYVPCGECVACLRRIRVFRAAKVQDPLEYPEAVDWTDCVPWKEYYEAVQVPSRKEKRVEEV